MISLICPTRDRDRKFHRMCESARATAVGEIEIISGTNSSNPHNYVNFTFMPDTPTVHMWNEMAKHAKGDLIMLASDDIIFATPGWDAALMEHYNALKNKIHVYHLRDSRDVDGTPHPIVTRAFMDAVGYFLCPIFLHWYVDTWCREIAVANNCFTHMKDFLLIHDKDSDKGQADDTHNRIRKMGWHARDSAVNDSCQHYLKHEKFLLRCAMNNLKLDKITLERASQ